MKYKNTLFFLMCFTVIFNFIPEQFRLISTKLMEYPLIAGFFYTIYCEYKYRNILIYKEKVLKYLFIYLSVLLISLFLGLYTYPYYEEILLGPLGNNERFLEIFYFFNNYGISITKQEFLYFWVFMKSVKRLIVDVLAPIITSYMIFCWYYDNWKEGFNVLVKGVIASVVIMILYSTVEVFYLAGSEKATEILKAINPYIHHIEDPKQYWYPLLWKGQLRSVFPEPSHIGNYLAMALPILWCGILENKYKKIYYPLLFIFTCMIFLTKARTPVAMFLGLSTLLFLLTLYYYKSDIFKRMCMIFIVSVCSFFVSLYFIGEHMSDKKIKENNISVATTKYIDDNLLSLASNNKRSNGTRYALIRSNLRIFIDNPLLGVGIGLTPGYIRDNFTQLEKKNWEINNWLKAEKTRGVLDLPLKALNEYVGRIAETGILGLIVFLYPFVYVLYYISKKLKTNCIRSTCIFLCLIGSLVAAMNVRLNVTFTIWLLLGLGYAMCFGKEQDESGDKT